MSISDDHVNAVRRHPCLVELASLAQQGSGWIFFPVTIFGVECLYGSREGPVVTETITVRAPDDTTVARLRTEDYLAPRGSWPRGVLWEYTGTLVDAVSQLRALPHHDHPLAPKLLRPASSAFATCHNG